MEFEAVDVELEDSGAAGDAGGEEVGGVRGEVARGDGGLGQGRLAWRRGRKSAPRSTTRPQAQQIIISIILQY